MIHTPTSIGCSRAMCRGGRRRRARPHIWIQEIFSNRLYVAPHDVGQDRSGTISE